VSARRRRTQILESKIASLFTTAVVGLLAVLSKWPKRRKHPGIPNLKQSGIGLEISTISPSDDKHGFRDIDFDQGWDWAV
jgi:hypothetical protein